MNSQHEDQKNHVPEIPSEDDWSDLDMQISAGADQLLSRRTKNELPVKRDARKPRIVIHGSRQGSEEIAPNAWGDKAEESFGEVDEPQSGEPEVVENRALGEKIKLPIRENPTFSNLRVNTIGVREDVASTSSFSNPQKAVAVVKVPDVYDLTNRRRRRSSRGERENWGDKRGRGKSHWILASGVVIVLLVIFSVFLSHRIAKKGKRNSEISIFSKLDAVQEEVVDDLEGVEKLIDFEKSHAKARHIFGAYVTARSAKDFERLIHNPSQNLPLLKKSWQPSAVNLEWTPDENTAWNLVEMGELKYGVLVGTGADFTKFTAYFRQNESGLKIDWRATSAYGSATFAELKEGKGDAGEIRAKVTRAEFYTYALPENRFRCFRLLSPDDEEAIWGYVNIDSDLDLELSKLFMPSEITGEVQTQVSITLSLSPGPEDSLSNQWMITKIKGKSWIEE